MGNLFVSLLVEDPFVYFSWILTVVFSICVHEFAHAYTALQSGDDTAARAGHLTLNPLVQMGRTSLFMLLFIGLAWGSVPVEPKRMRRKSGAALTAVAGPVANLTLCVAAALLTTVTRRIFSPQDALAEFFWTAAYANAVLFLLNMLPVPMLDGWTVYRYVIPSLQRIKREQARPFSAILLFLIVLTPLGDLLWKTGERFAVGLVSGWEGLLGIF